MASPDRNFSPDKCIFNLKAKGLGYEGCSFECHRMSGLECPQIVHDAVVSRENIPPVPALIEPAPKVIYQSYFEERATENSLR